MRSQPTRPCKSGEHLRKQLFGFVASRELGAETFDNHEPFAAAVPAILDDPACDANGRGETFQGFLERVYRKIGKHRNVILPEQTSKEAIASSDFDKST